MHDAFRVGSCIEEESEDTRHCGLMTANYFGDLGLGLALLSESADEGIFFPAESGAIRYAFGWRLSQLEVRHRDSHTRERQSARGQRVADGVLDASGDG